MAMPEMLRTVRLSLQRLVGLEHRGQGLAREAGRAVTQLAHQAGHLRVWATIRPANHASATTARSIGYRRVQSQADSKGPLDYYVSSVTNGRSENAG